MSVQRNGFKDGQKDTSSKVGGDSGYAGYKLYDLATSYDDLLKGHKSLADLIDGADGDDVIIGYGGNDILVGGTGHDDLSGGLGDDQLVGGSWNKDPGGANQTDEASVDIGVWVLTNDVEGDSSDTYTFYREFTQDNFKDDYVAESSSVNNGTDTIYGYDELLDVIEVNALANALNAIVEASSGNLTSIADVTADDLRMSGYVAYINGQLSIDLDGDGGANDDMHVWFNVKVDENTAPDPTTFTGTPTDFTPLEWSNSETVTLEIVGLHFTFTNTVTPE